MNKGFLISPGVGNSQYLEEYHDLELDIGFGDELKECY
jgi:hypothetical protein